MVIKPKLLLLLLLCITAVSAYPQNVQSEPSLNIGDPAPPLKLAAWLKGKPVEEFKKGRVYVLEFWATWCGHCIDAMPHLSKLAAKYKDKVTFIGVDVFEGERVTLKKVKAFVDSMGRQMDYSVAKAAGNFMENHWMKATGEIGIPVTFVVNGEGKLVWIGHPEEGLDNVLHKIIINSFDFEVALTKRKVNRHWAILDDSLSETLSKYYKYDNDTNLKVLMRPDSALLAIAEILKTEPSLKYAPLIGSTTFRALLQTNQDKAYEFGMQVMATPTYVGPYFDLIITGIEKVEQKFTLQPKIYQLGAEACQRTVDEMNDVHRTQLGPLYYHKMSAWYVRAGDKAKAIASLEKVVDILRKQKEFSSSELAEYDSQLQRWIANQELETEDVVGAGTDDSLKKVFLRYNYNFIKHGEITQPDSVLAAVEKIITTDPKLKYAPYIVNWKFNSLFKTGKQHKAYEYGKQVLLDSTYTSPAYVVIARCINYFGDKLKLIPELYQLGAEACQMSIDNISAKYFPTYAPKYYHKMAICYWRMGDKAKAIKTEEKAIEIFKKQKEFSSTDLAEYDSQLRRYKKT